MGKIINQRQAKAQIKDYLSVTGRKGVTAFVSELEMFSQVDYLISIRGFEKWLANPQANLQQRNWQVLQTFLESKQFQSVLPYSQDNQAREETVAEGLLSLYGGVNLSCYVSPVRDSSAKQTLTAFARFAACSGSWYSFKESCTDTRPEQYMKIVPASSKSYAKFARLVIKDPVVGPNVFSTGFVFYVSSGISSNGSKAHAYILHSWHKRCVLHSDVLPCKANQSNFKDTENGDIVVYENQGDGLRIQIDGMLTFNSNRNSKSDARPVSFMNKQQEYEKNLDLLIEEVLPHVLP